MREFLDFKKTKQEITLIFKKHIKDEYDYINELYNRYNIKSTLVLFCSDINIIKELKSKKRKLDKFIHIKINDKYFYFFFLHYTDIISSFGFIKNIEHDIFHIKKINYRIANIEINNNNLLTDINLMFEELESF